jgi:hypothetical protein
MAAAASMAACATVLCGMLLTGGALAADEVTLLGFSLNTNRTTGEIECSGSCILVLKNSKGMRISVDSGRVETGGATVALKNVARARLAFDGYVYDVQGMSEYKQEPDGVITVTADKVRGYKIVSTL